MSCFLPEWLNWLNLFWIAIVFCNWFAGPKESSRSSSESKKVRKLTHEAGFHVCYMCLVDTFTYSISNWSIDCQVFFHVVLFEGFFVFYVHTSSQVESVWFWKCLSFCLSDFTYTHCLWLSVRAKNDNVESLMNHILSAEIEKTRSEKHMA